MNLKNSIAILFIAIISNTILAQKRTIGLKECVKLAIANKSSILALQADAAIDSLNIKQLKAKNLPQVAIAYDYLYNPIIRTNIVPTGQFSPIPTNDVRAIQFGTKFNQSAGLQLMQPIFDASIRSKINESKLQARIKKDEINTANEELSFDVAKSFIAVLIYERQVNISKQDTLRTAKTLQIAKDRFEQGKILKMELNKAKINQNNSSFAFKELLSALVIEKIYLGFLTNLEANSFDVQDTDNLLKEENLNWLSEKTNETTISKVKEFDSKINLVQQQIKSEKYKYLPKLNFNGYLGADQFTNNLQPFENNTWFGNSFVGLSFKLPLLIGENKNNKINQYKSQITSFNFQKEEILKVNQKNRQTALEEINLLKEESKFYEKNLDLLKENLTLYNERLEAGQETLINVNLEEIEYQKEIQKLNTSNFKIWQQWLLYIKNAGLMARIN